MNDLVLILPKYINHTTITTATTESDSELKISSAVENPEEYLNLTDDILRTIERSKSPGLAKSREIMKRLRTRDLYKCK